MRKIVLQKNFLKGLRQHSATWWQPLVKNDLQRRNAESELRFEKEKWYTIHRERFSFREETRRVCVRIADIKIIRLYSVSAASAINHFPTTLHIARALWHYSFAAGGFFMQLQAQRALVRKLGRFNYLGDLCWWYTFVSIITL